MTAIVSLNYEGDMVLRKIHNHPQGYTVTQPRYPVLQDNFSGIKYSTKPVNFGNKLGVTIPKEIVSSRRKSILKIYLT